MITNSAAASQVFTVNNALNHTFSGVLGGTGTNNNNFGLTKAGVGMLTLSGNNTYTGVTTISQGTLTLGAADRIANASNLVMNGGALNTGGFGETLGTFGLSNTSSIDFASGASILSLSGLGAFDTTKFLTLLNWSGSDVGGGTDRFFIGTTTVLSAPQLASISFVNPTAYAAGTYSAAQLSTGEIVAIIPEPSTVTALIGLAGLFGLSRRRRA